MDAAQAAISTAETYSKYKEFIDSYNRTMENWKEKIDFVNSKIKWLSGQTQHGIKWIEMKLKFYINKLKGYISSCLEWVEERLAALKKWLKDQIDSISKSMQDFIDRKVSAQTQAKVLKAASIAGKIASTTTQVATGEINPADLIPTYAEEVLSSAVETVSLASQTLIDVQNTLDSTATSSISDIENVAS